MSVVCKCPACKNLCAFKQNHIGRQATCLRCGTAFIVPAESDTVPQKAQIDNQPIPNFYENILITNWKIFFKPSSLTSSVFLAALILFKFFLAFSGTTILLPGFALNLPIGWVTVLICWGCLFWYYMQTIQDAALGIEELPEITIGAGFDFLGNVLKSICIYTVSLCASILPFSIIGMLFEKLGFNAPWLQIPLLLCGFFIFPMVLSIISSGQGHWLLIRPDFIWTPIYKAFLPYTAVALQIITAWFLQWQTRYFGQFDDAPTYTIVLYLLFEFFTQIFTVTAMRSVGLFCHHYACYIKWFDPEFIR